MAALWPEQFRLGPEVGFVFRQSLHDHGSSAWSF
jgi:hypothetical protein